MCKMCLTCASSDHAQSVVDGAINQADMITLTPARCAVLSSRVNQTRVVTQSVLASASLPKPASHLKCAT